MRIFLDETALRFPEGHEATRIAIETLLDVVAATRGAPEEEVSRSWSAEDQEVRPGLTLLDFLYVEVPAPCIVDARRRLILALDQMKKWDDDVTPDAFEVELNGQVVEAPTLAWAWKRRREGHAVGCLGLPDAGRSRPQLVGMGGVTVELHFISNPDDRRSFLRQSIVIERLSPLAFESRAARAFPTLLWQDDAMADLRTEKASFFDGDRLPITVHHLGVLDDHGATIFQAHVEQQVREQHLGSRGVSASTESGRAKSNKKAVRDHTRRWRGRDVQFWWHTKIVYDDGRIHFLHEPPSRDDPMHPDGRLVHPDGRIVVGICRGHLTV